MISFRLIIKEFSSSLQTSITYIRDRLKFLTDYDMHVIREAKANAITYALNKRPELIMFIIVKKIVY